MLTASFGSPSSNVSRSKLERNKDSIGSGGCSHSWTLQEADHPDNGTGEDRILIHKQGSTHKYHSQIWGEWVNDVQFRGYYHEKKMAICVHGWSPRTLSRLEALIIRTFKSEKLEIIYCNWA